jgi:iron-sulfur cluster insertion protein
MEAQKDLCLLRPKDRQCDAQLFATSHAIQRLLELRKEEAQSPEEAPRFRIRVDSGGCFGFQYCFNFDHRKTGEDIIFYAGSLEFIVDEISLGFLNGVILDYVEDMMSSSFQIKNPNASSSCGCGSSFSL